MRAARAPAWLRGSRSPLPLGGPGAGRRGGRGRDRRAWRGGQQLPRAGTQRQHTPEIFL